MTAILVRLGFGRGGWLANRILSQLCGPEPEPKNLVGSLKNEVRTRCRKVPPMVDSFTDTPLCLMPGDCRIILALSGSSDQWPYRNILLNQALYDQLAPVVILALCSDVKVVNPFAFGCRGHPVPESGVPDRHAPRFLLGDHFGANSY